jgi:hypothetical protein
MSRRPPFENRWTSGKTAWRWHQELEALGVENVRLRLALKDARNPVDFPDPDIPGGFVEDWLNYHDRKVRRGSANWKAAAVFLALAAAAAILATWPMVVRAL